MKSSIYQEDSHVKIRRVLRRNSTRAEKLLWFAIRNNRLGYKFRRQYSIGTYIVDFYCRELKLILEADGYSHSDSQVYARDIEKQKYLEKMGYKVKRYTDEQVLNSIEAVYLDLEAACKQLAHFAPHPALSQRERGFK